MKLLLPLAALALLAQQRTPYASHVDGIPYAATPEHNALTNLTVKDPSISAVLAQLNIATDTQALTFAKTSFQAVHIRPGKPRAIYFNDTVAIGYVPGGEGIEAAVYDPALGAAFYRLQGERFVRQNSACLNCHHGTATMGVPGFFIGSVHALTSGQPIHRPAIVTDHRTPLADRWGGWYITGSSSRHKGNAMVTDPAEPDVLEGETEGLQDLSRKFDATPYPGGAVSDIVALMVFEHQTQALNRFARLQWLHKLGRPYDGDIEETVDYLLFKDEAPLEKPVKGVSTFAKTFPATGPLRDLDLQTKLFKSPVSYMVLHPAFKALPDPIRSRILARLRSQPFQLPGIP